MFLLDTNVVSELRKAGSGRIDANVLAWSESVDADTLYVSAITIMELEQGVLLRERRDPKQGRLLRQWLENQVLPGFGTRILPVSLPVARRCAALHVPDPRSERDALIAATAIEEDIILATRNTKDFLGTGARLTDPWE